MDEQDKSEREHLRSHIILLRTNARLATDHPYLNRSYLLYLLRLAPLTRRTANGVERTTTGAYYGLPKQNFGEFANKFVAKFGYTQHAVKATLAQVVLKSLMTGFPATEELDPVFTLAIALPPCDPAVLLELEHGLRRCLDRESVRLGQYSERFDHVYTDEQCNKLFTIYQKYSDRLEAGRKKAVATVAQEDFRRKQKIASHIEAERANQRREYARYVQQCRRIEALEKSRLEKAKVEDDEVKEKLANLHAQHERLQKYMRAQQHAAIKNIASDTPRVNVAKILADALIDASKVQE